MISWAPALFPTVPSSKVVSMTLREAAYRRACSSSSVR